MAKKQKKATAQRVPTKRQLSKWQRQMKIRRIVIVAAVVFLAGILGWVGYELYQDYRTRFVIEVNDFGFTMDYYVDMLAAFTAIAGMNSTFIFEWATSIADMVANATIEGELLRQGAKEELRIEVAVADIDARLQERRWPNTTVYRDWVRTVLVQEELQARFGADVPPDPIEQAHIQVMLVESREVADEVIATIEAGGNFTALLRLFSRNFTIAGDLGWLPRELMPNALIADAAFNLTSGDIGSVYDATAIKNLGYWLIEVTDKREGEIKARAMLLGSKAEAEWVKAELLGGNFSYLAQRYSQHESRDRGGELGWLRPRNMTSTFDAIAFNLTLNQVSEPVLDVAVQTTGGYWMVNVIDRAERALADEVREQFANKLLTDWFEEWRADSTITNRLTREDKLSAVRTVLERRVTRQ